MLLRADARQIPLADATVQCCVTSPPYFGLRDYGVDGQIGLEPTPEAYVGALVGVFREVRRVLTDDGTVWLNLGDSYATFAGKVGDCPGGGAQGERWKSRGVMTAPNRMPIDGLKPKDLIGIPWRVAFALQADGWYLRSDIIWSKPNPMPESVTDRPTRSHEYLFLLTKTPRYYYDGAAIQEPAAYPAGAGNTGPYVVPGQRAGANANLGGSRHLIGARATRQKRDVWTLRTEPCPEAHFATMPEALVEPCILAGSILGGVVLDPFCGSGTVGAVAERLGRRWVGLDLNPAYHALAQVRTVQRGLRFDVA